MFQKLLIPALLIVAVIAVLPSQVYGVGTWSAWLYHNGVVWCVDNSGTILQRIDLPASGGSLFSESVLISNDGRTIGYTVDDRQLLLYNTALGRVVVAYSLPESISADSFDVGVSSEQFSEDGTKVAYAYQNAGGAWRIILIDTTTGSLIASLDQPTAFPIEGVPLLFDVTETRVLFNLQGSSAAWTGYAWETTTGAVNPTGMQLNDEYAVFRPTGDLIMPGDLELATLSDSHNALLVYHTLSGQSFPFYGQPGLSLHEPRFIQNGERIIVGIEASWGDELRIVERDGETVGSFPADDITGVFGVPDGLIYTVDSQLWVVNTRGSRIDTGTFLANFDQPAQLVGVVSPPDNSGIYEGWANLSYEAPVRPVYTPAPTLENSPLDSIGMDVQILVVMGTRAAQPVFELTPNSVVTLPPPIR